VGVRTKRYKVKIFVLSAVYASLAGSVYAYYLTFISPKTFDIFFSIELVTMVIVGGMGSIWGVLFGTIFLTSLPNVLHFFDEYKDMFYGLILVVILVFLPQGVVVAIRERWLARSGPSAPEAIEFRHEPRSLRLAVDLPRSWNSKSAPPSATAKEPILSARNVSIRFGGLMALAQVSFEIPRGEVTSLIGPNGAGKTTMINVISGTYSPETGNIFFEGRDITNQRPYRMAEMGLTRTFQTIQVFENMTVLENVMVGLHAQTRNEFTYSMFHLPGFRKEENRIEQRAWEVLRFFDLEDKRLLPASSLSYGQQKRVEMARALATHPRLVLLDEPVAGLNMTESLEIAQLIARIRDQGVTVLLVEHDMNLVMSVSDNIIVLNYGRKIAEGDPQVVQKDEQVLSAYLGSVA
jgi:branched-chain amino acid transport system permease protein